MECTNKIKFSIKELAEKKLKELQAEGKSLNKIVYKCSKCLKWHIGSNIIYIKNK